MVLGISRFQGLGFRVIVLPFSTGPTNSETGGCHPDDAGLMNPTYPKAEKNWVLVIEGFIFCYRIEETTLSTIDPYYGNLKLNPLTRTQERLLWGSGA